MRGKEGEKHGVLRSCYRYLGHSDSVAPSAVQMFFVFMFRVGGFDNGVSCTLLRGSSLIEFWVLLGSLNP